MQSVIFKAINLWIYMTYYDSFKINLDNGNSSAGQNQKVFSAADE